MSHKKEDNLPKVYCNLHCDQKIKSWDEALPLGNGFMGCLIWGNGSPLRLSLDRGDLWDTRPSQKILDPDFKYEKLIKYVKDKDQARIKNCFDAPYGEVTPTKIPAGKIFLNFDKEADRIESNLSLNHAEAYINLVFGINTVYMKSFIHANEKSGFIKITGTNPLPKLHLSNPDFGNIKDEQDKKDDLPREISNGSLQQLRYPKPQIGQSDNTKWFIQKTAEGMKYGIILAFVEKEGDMELVYTITSSKDGTNWFEDAQKKVLEQLRAGYDLCFVEHMKWWESFWDKSSISLPDKDFEKQWYLTNYLFGSCSRKNYPPMPLQGVWTADNGELPPWKGDYHNDTNTQFSYTHYLKANHLDEGESFIDFLWNLVPVARKFAEDFFDAPGLCLPSTMSIDGKALGGWAMYSYNMTNQVWLCQSFEMYWRYTGDEDFLKNKAYQYFEETATCTSRWLIPDDKGKLLLPLSSSPEIHDDTLEAWLTPNSNFDLALLRYLFKTLASMSEVLKNGKTEYWLKKLDSLHELAVNDNNELMLSSDESLNESHRHHSHAMAIFPLKLLNYQKNKKDREIIDATVARLEMLGTGLWTGFAFPWMAELYAVQGNGEGAAYQLKLFWENFCSSNGFHLNGDYKKRGLSWWHYRPLTLEANMCAADALQEMLLQSDEGIIRVFPAIPEDWKRKGVRFRNLREWNGIMVSAEMSEGKLVTVELEATKKGEFMVNNCFDVNNLIIEKDGQIRSIGCEIGKEIKICLGKGEKVTIRPSMGNGIGLEMNSYSL